MIPSDSQPNNDTNIQGSSVERQQQSSYNPAEPSIQNIRAGLHRPITASQQQYIQKANENPLDPKNDDIRDFVRQIGEYPPTIPDSVTSHFLKSTGVEGVDARVSRMVALAAQKHIADIVLDSMQNARMKGLGQTKKSTKDTKFTLTEELLEAVLTEYGIQNIRPPYHT